MLFSRDRGGDETAQLYLLDGEGIETPLCEGFEGSMHTPGEWSRDGKSVPVAANRRYPSLFDLHLLGIEGSRPRRREVWRNPAPGFLQSMRLAPDGSAVGLVVQRSSFDQEVLEIRVEGGELRSLSPGAAGTRFRDCAFASDGGRLFVVTDSGSEYLYIAEIDLCSLAIEPLLTDEWDIEALSIGYRRAHREAEYGSLARDRDFLARISPAHHLDRLAAPLIVLHGANDPRVPLSEAEQVVAALQARNIPVEFLVFPDEGHGIVKRQNKLVAYPAIVAFLEKHVKGE